MKGIFTDFNTKIYKLILIFWKFCPKTFFVFVKDVDYYYHYFSSDWMQYEVNFHFVLGEISLNCWYLSNILWADDFHISTGCGKRAAPIPSAFLDTKRKIVWSNIHALAAIVGAKRGTKYKTRLSKAPNTKPHSTNRVFHPIASHILSWFCIQNTGSPSTDWSCRAELLLFKLEGLNYLFKRERERK